MVYKSFSINCIIRVLIIAASIYQAMCQCCFIRDIIKIIDFSNQTNYISSSYVVIEMDLLFNCSEWSKYGIIGSFHQFSKMDGL